MAESGDATGEGGGEALGWLAAWTDHEIQTTCETRADIAADAGLPEGKRPAENAAGVLQGHKGLVVSNVAGAVEIEDAAMDGIAIMAGGDIVDDVNRRIKDHAEVLGLGLEAEGELPVHLGTFATQATLEAAGSQE